MSETPCPACGNPSPDGLLCRLCTNRLKADLAALPELLRELDVTVTRQARIGSGAAKDRTPLPVNLAASDTAWAVRNTLLTWVRTIEIGDADGLPDKPGAWCNWLGRRIERIRGHDEAGMLADEIGYCVVSIRQVVDLPPDLLYCGQCPTCGRDLMAKPGAKVVTCKRCERAGITTVEVDVEVTRRLMLTAAQRDGEARLLTLSELIEHIDVFHGYRLNPDTVRQWVKRGRLMRRPGGLYDVTEVVDLVRDAADRKRKQRRAAS